MQNTVEPGAPGAPEVESPESNPIPPAAPAPAQRPKEFGGPTGPEPTRYGDWEKKGRCIDF
ncbi:MAG: DUF1674 domain-containing protein [Gammaproteobacteria bacterium]